MHGVIWGFAFKLTFNLFNHGEDNHILNCDLKKADIRESIFMVFQDRQAGSNALIFYRYNSIDFSEMLSNFT